MTTPITIIGLQFSNFVRSVQWLCEEKKIPYTITTEYDGDDVSPGNAALARYHPYSRIPVAMIDDTPVCETATILRYLDTTRPGPAFQPEDPRDRANVDQWSGFASVYVDQAIIRNVLMEFAFPKGDGGQVRHDVVKRHLGKARAALRPVSHQLDENAYICGDTPSLADLILGPILDYLDQSPLGARFMPEHGSLHEYLERLRTRDASRKVLGPIKRG